METPRLFCTFRVDDRLFGVDILDVKEVTAETNYTRVAHAPDEVLGLVNIRGHIYLALDLRRLIGLPASTVTDESRMVLFKPCVGNAFGVLVDRISEIESVSPDRIDAFTKANDEAAAGQARRTDLVNAVCKLDGELLVILDARRFLAVVEQKLAATV
ncbi:chemotaxis protein CheW [Singulisphaera rosea]